jgi:tetratricopeptide (TPR) repeat protein
MSKEVVYARRTDSAARHIPLQRDAERIRGWTINFRLLLWTVIIALVLGASFYVVRSFQVRRSAVALFERAQQLEAEGDLPSAANSLFRYLKFYPDDGSARVLLAQVFDKTALTIGAKQRATEHYFAALTYFPDRNDLRVRLAELLLELDRIREAQQESIQVLCGSRELPRNEVLENVKRYQDRFESAKLLASNTEAPRALRVLEFWPKRALGIARNGAIGRQTSCCRWHKAR